MLHWSCYLIIDKQRNKNYWEEDVRPHLGFNKIPLEVEVTYKKGDNVPVEKYVVYQHWTFKKLRDFLNLVTKVD